jgi:type II restriction enzyme
LKGGVDPAGVDEHWKTANSALNRIRTSFEKVNISPNTFYIGAAIETSMAFEIFYLMQSGSLCNAANLTSERQLTTICDWMINL